MYMYMCIYTCIYIYLFFMCIYVHVHVHPLNPYYPSPIILSYRIQYASQSWCELFGHDPFKIQGQSCKLLQGMLYNSSHEYFFLIDFICAYAVLAGSVLVWR
jgi:hypothetical protein